MTGDQARAMRTHIGLSQAQMATRLGYASYNMVQHNERKGANALPPEAQQRYLALAEKLQRQRKTRTDA